jgi:hypothetical protein
MRAACALGAALVAGPAQAHLVDTGFGAYYDGLAHVVLTPADLLVVLGLALLAGQRGAGVARTVLFILPLAWLAGGFVGTAWPSMALPAVATTLSFALAGALVALEARMRLTGARARPGQWRDDGARWRQRPRARGGGHGRVRLDHGRVGRGDTADRWLDAHGGAGAGQLDRSGRAADNRVARAVGSGRRLREAVN